MTSILIRDGAIPGIDLAQMRHEAALIVETPSGTTLVLNDIVGNIRGAKGFGGWLLGLMGFAGQEPHVPRPV